MADKRLTKVATKLLEGYLIDQWSDFENFEFLNDVEFLDQLNNHGVSTVVPLEIEGDNPLLAAEPV
jgi:hypothetical protein